MFNLSEDAIDEFQRLRLGVQTPAAAERIWNRLLSIADQRQLGGDLESSYAQGGTTGIWQRLHGGSAERAVVELAIGLNLADPTTANWLLRELGEPELGGDRRATQAVPFWNVATSELRFHGEVIRRVQRPSQAVNVVAVLDAFQGAGWPARVDDPLPGAPDPERLRKTVRVLDDGLTGIRFRADGTGKGIAWAPI